MLLIFILLRTLPQACLQAPNFSFVCSMPLLFVFLCVYYSFFTIRALMIYDQVNQKYQWLGHELRIIRSRYETQGNNFVLDFRIVDGYPQFAWDLGVLNPPSISSSFYSISKPRQISPFFFFGCQLIETKVIHNTHILNVGCKGHKCKL